MSHRFAVAALLASVSLCACTVGPDYERPDYSRPDVDGASAFDVGYKGVAAGEAITARWWEVFDDALLTSLIEDAAADNLNVKEAAARVREARALRGVARGEFLPQGGLDAGVTETELSENGQLLSFAPPGVDDRLSIYNAGFDASWERDVFGGRRRALEAAGARLESAEEERRNVLLSAMAETARNYVELRGAQARLRITMRNAALQGDTARLVGRRFDVGSASRLDVARAQAQLASTEADIPRIRTEVRAAIHRLGVLTGRPPQALVGTLVEATPTPAPPDLVPVGLRSDILRRRPDVRSAERRLAAATAEVGVAVANLFPKFSLTGVAGFESISFDDWITASSGTWAIGPSLSFPVFRQGQLRDQVKAAEARADAETAAYERAVLSALEDAENAIVAYAEEIATRAKLVRAVDQQRVAVKLIQQRYREGGVDFIDVLDSERALLTVEERLARSSTAMSTSLVALYKALGGGWKVYEPSADQGDLAAAAAASPDA